MSRRPLVLFDSVGSPAALDRVDLPAAKAAVGRAAYQAALFAKALWLRRAQDLGIRRSGGYLRGIQDAPVELVSSVDTPTGLEVVYRITNRAPNAKIVEDGHPAFHLPSRINWASSNGRIKRGPNGPYLHIPFRHAAYQDAAERARSGMTPGTLRTMMPEEIHQQAKQLRRTVPRREGPIRSAGGQFQQADRYDHGQRLRVNTPGPMMISGPGGTWEAWRGPRAVAGRTAGGAQLHNPAHKTAKYSGLFKSGPRGHSQYMTIRTITPNSPGWNIPAFQGYGVARQVAAALNGGVGGDRFRDLLVTAVHGGS